MTFKISLIIFVFAVLVLSPSVYAQTNTPSPLRPGQGLKNSLKTVGQERKEMNEASRAAMKEAMDAFKEEIATIRDAKKKAIVERIASKIPNANTRMTDKMNGALEKLTQILNGINEKASAAQSSGEDTTALESAISSAEAAITNAQSMVDAQAAKTYSADITDDLTLRNTIGKLVSQFRLDLSNAHKAVADARQAVAKAITELAKLKKDNTATGSANI
jgi:hypothetical protein